MTIEELTHLIVPPVYHRYDQIQVSWDDVEKSSGFAFPHSFQLCLDAYGVGYFCGFLMLYSPLISDRDRIEDRSIFQKRFAEISSAYDYLREKHPKTFTYSVGLEEGQIIPFAGTVNGDDLFWVVRGVDSNDWPLLVFGQSDFKFHMYSGDITSFISRLIIGSERCDSFPEDAFSSRVFLPA